MQERASYLVVDAVILVKQAREQTHKVRGATGEVAPDRAVVHLGLPWKKGGNGFFFAKNTTHTKNE